MRKFRAPLDFDQTFGFSGEGPNISQQSCCTTSIFACLIPLALCALFFTVSSPVSWIFLWTFHASTWIAAVGLGGALLARSCFPMAVDFGCLCWDASGPTSHADVPTPSVLAQQHGFYKPWRTWICSSAEAGGRIERWWTSICRRSQH